jgi:site-specific recombinase XerC
MTLTTTEYATMSYHGTGAPVMRRFLTDPEQQRLLKAARASADPLAQRDYWWMRAVMALGMRVEEWSLITASQAQAALYTGWLVVPACARKGRKQGHEYAVTTTVRECLNALLAVHHEQAGTRAGCELPLDAPLLYGRGGQRLSVRSYQARLKMWVLASGLPAEVSLHWLRHTRAMNIMRRSNSKNPLKLVQAALGHASLNSTAVYTHMARDELARDLAQVDGTRMSRAAARELAQQAQQAHQAHPVQHQPMRVAA